MVLLIIFGIIWYSLWQDDFGNLDDYNPETDY